MKSTQVEICVEVSARINNKHTTTYWTWWKIKEAISHSMTWRNIRSKIGIMVVLKSEWRLMYQTLQKRGSCHAFSSPAAPDVEIFHAFQITAPYVVTSIIPQRKLIEAINAGISRQISAVTSHYFSSWEIWFHNKSYSAPSSVSNQIAQQKNNLGCSDYKWFKRRMAIISLAPSRWLE